MSSATIFDVPTVPRLQTLLQDVKLGTILIPRFQRTFVWKDEQRFRLLDSVLKGLPIGSLMVWRSTRDNLSCYERLGPFKLEVPQDQKGYHSYLLDGLQRLTTLYAALNKPAEIPAISPPEDDVFEDDSSAPDSPVWPIYLDLDSYTESPRGTANRPDLGFRLHRLIQGWEPPQTWLPLYTLFDPELLFDFQRRLHDAGNRKLAREAERISVRFKDYPVPIVPITTDNLDLVTEGFQRVNTEGVRLSEVHMLAALTFGRDYDAGKGIHDVRRSLSKSGWGSVSDTLLLNALKAAFEIEVQKEHVIELQKKLKESATSKPFDELSQHVQAAVSFLRTRCGILGPKLLPYEYQLVALIEAARAAGDLQDHSIADALERWFWATTYTGHFTSMNSTELGRAIEHVQRIARRESSLDPLPADMVREIDVHARFNFSSARSTAFALLLARRDPLDSAGASFDAPALLAAAGVEVMERILPQMPASDPANRVIARPGDIRNLREVLRDCSRPRYREICESHFVGEQAAAALALGRNEDFLRARRTTLFDVEARDVERWGLMLRAPA